MKENEMDDGVCLALRIARIFNQMVRDLGDGDDDDIAERLEELKEAASHLTPSSVEGAAFQLWVASAETDRTSDADAPAVREASRRQSGSNIALPAL
jgi:hypothetical protein